MTTTTESTAHSADRSGSVAHVVEVGSLLGQIPGLWAELPRYLTGSTPVAYEAKIKRLTSGSRPPLDLEVLDLLEGTELKEWALTVRPSIRRPTVPAACEYLAQVARDTTEVFPQFPAAIEALYWRYRRAARRMPERAVLNCLTCGNRATIESGWLVCYEVEEHARTVEDIEHEHRYRPAETVAQLMARFPQLGTDPKMVSDKLSEWRRSGSPRVPVARKEGRKNLYMPWDVFCRLNPAVADAISQRDEVLSGSSNV